MQLVFLGQKSAAVGVGFSARGFSARGFVCRRRLRFSHRARKALFVFYNIKYNTTFLTVKGVNCMKKSLLWTAVLILALTVWTSLTALAAGDPVLVYVTIANGELMTAREPVYVTDKDGDGELTINDTLVAAHEQLYSGGAAGYSTATSDLGMYIERLWGVENGGSYGYYKNNEMAMGLTTPVVGGDHVIAYVYTDPAGFSDVFTYFSETTISANPGEPQELVLCSIGFDENFMPVTIPVEGATITIGGKPTGYKTDADGHVTINIDERGTHVISAVSDTQRIVPPVCIAEIGAAQAPQTGGGFAVAAFAALAVLAGGAVLARKGRNEKQ
jgi:hypothetical protein